MIAYVMFVYLRPFVDRPQQFLDDQLVPGDACRSAAKKCSHGGQRHAKREYYKNRHRTDGQGQADELTGGGRATAGEGT